MTQPESPWAHGRSLRNNRGRAMLPALEHGAANAGCPADAPAALAWLQAARHEFASIASFRHVARSLEALGAPSDLVERAVVAADDERHHTKICLDLANCAGATSARIVTDVAALTGLLRLPDDLLTTARSALLDGVVGEGFVARRLNKVAARTPPHQVALQRMADDERRHALLGADIVAWCVSVRPWLVDQLKVDLADVDQSAPMAPEVTAMSDADRRTHGLYLDSEAADAWATNRRAAGHFIDSVRSESLSISENFQVSFKTS